jgi:Membrane carboxypeptidase/penicillin-binding protein
MGGGEICRLFVTKKILTAYSKVRNLKRGIFIDNKLIFIFKSLLENGLITKAEYDKAVDKAYKEFLCDKKIG